MQSRRNHGCLFKIAHLGSALGSALGSFLSTASDADSALRMASAWARATAARTSLSAFSRSSADLRGGAGSIAIDQSEKVSLGKWRSWSTRWAASPGLRVAGSVGLRARLVSASAFAQASFLALSAAC